MTADTLINVAIAATFLAFVGSWIVIEAYTAAKGVPSISERLKAAGKTATILPIAAALALGLLVGHWWAGA